MDYPITYDVKIGDLIIGQIEGTASIAKDDDGDWYIDDLRFEGMKVEHGVIVEQKTVEMPDTHALHDAILLQVLQKDRADIDEKWAAHCADAGNRADEQRDEIVTNELMAGA